MPGRVANGEWKPWEDRITRSSANTLSVTINIKHIQSFSDLIPTVPDPLAGVRPAEPGGRAGPGQGWPEPSAAGGSSARAESTSWQDSARNHHKVPQSHTGRDQPGCAFRAFYIQTTRGDEHLKMYLFQMHSCIYSCLCH